MTFQHTLKSSIQIDGIGLHSGRPARVGIYPAPANQGVVFFRTDFERPVRIPAHYKNVVRTKMATTLGSGDATLSTVEHLLAALAGMGIDNALVEVDGPELPILDGSSAQFAEAIAAAGTVTQSKPRRHLSLRRKVEVKVGEKWAVATPSSQLEIHASVDWDHPSIGFQECHYVDGKTSFADIASARTFGFLRDVDALRRAGLALGGSLDNAVVLDDALVLNPGGLRFPNEFARHKALDALGDFMLAGVALRADVRLHRAGHDLHSQLLEAIFRDPENYVIEDAEIVEEKRARRVHPALAGSFAALG